MSCCQPVKSSQNYLTENLSYVNEITPMFNEFRVFIHAINDLCVVVPNSLKVKYTHPFLKQQVF